MAVDPDVFVRMRPYMYHVSARDNLVALQRTMSLEPAASLMRAAGRTDLLRWRRSQAVRLSIGNNVVALQDQTALIESNIAFRRDWSFADFVEYLNEHVFFWPGTAEGPVKSGLRLYEHQDDASPLMIRMPSAQLFAENPGAVPLYCQFNSAAPRQQHGRKVVRGPHLFSAAADFSRRESEVVELAFRSKVSLPATTEFLHTGEWVRLSSLAA